jgi:hypothetical protein
MSKFTARFLASAASVALGASLLSTAAFAQVTALGLLNPDDAGSYNETVATSPPAVDVSGTFELTENAKTALSATIAVNSSAAYTPGVLELLEGATVIESVPLVFTGSQYTASFSKIIGPGDYTAEITGSVNVAKLGVGGTVTTSGVPEPATWAMTVLGFMGLGYAAFRQRKTKISMLAA